MGRSRHFQYRGHQHFSKEKWQPLGVHTQSGTLSQAKIKGQIPISAKIRGWHVPLAPLNLLWSTDQLSQWSHIHIQLSLTFLILRMMLYFWVSIKLSSMTRIAMLTSSSFTYSRRCILAWASDIRITDSMWRTVMGILPVACVKKETNTNITFGLRNLETNWKSD